MTWEIILCCFDYTQRKTSSDGDEQIELDKTLKAKGGNKAVDSDEAKAQAPSNLVFGYLNLFSDGVVSMFHFTLVSLISLSFCFWRNLFRIFLLE